MRRLGHAAAMVAKSAADHRPLVQDLAGDHITHDRRGHGLVISGPVLLTAQQHVAGDRTLHTCQKAAAPTHQRDAYAALGAMPHQRRREPDRTEADDAAEQVHRYTRTFGPVGLDDRVFAILVQPRVFGSHVERVKMPAHRRVVSYRWPARANGRRSVTCAGSVVDSPA